MNDTTNPSEENIAVDFVMPGIELKPESDLAPSTDEDRSQIKEQVVDAIRTIFDPEIPVNVYDLGLIYSVEVDENGRVAIEMTLTSPNCPVAGTLPGEVEVIANSVSGVSAAWVDLVWDPPWGPERMSEAAQLQMGLF